MRALEVERKLQRMALQQGLLLCLVAAAALANVGTVLSVSALPRLSSALFTAAGVFGVLTLAKLFQVRRLDRTERKILEAAAAGA